MSNKLDFSKELIGRRALITGGTRGIGAAIAQRLLDAGAKVVVTARSRGEALPAGAAFVAGDVASASGVKAIAAGALDALGGLDILVNNAGGASGFPQGTASIPDEAWQSGFALNLFAAIRLTNALLPALRESKAGAIVNISSGAATMAVGAVAHYGAAKAALNSYSRSLAIDLAPLKKSAIVYDIVYAPLETELLAQARARGNPVVDGLGMLLHQAAPAFERWFGVRPEVTSELRSLVISDLAREAR